MQDLFFTWGIAVFALLAVEKIVAFLGIADPPRRVTLFVAAVLVALWLVMVLLLGFVNVSFGR